MDASGAGDTTLAKRAKTPWDSATGVDRLSALPDDIVAKILVAVSSPEAVRTSVLSKRWHTLWKLLPDLHFPFFPEPAAAGSFGEAIEGHQVRLRDLKVEGHGQDGLPRSLTTWLPAAAGRVTGGFTLLIKESPTSSERPEDEAVAVEFPCFKHATSISIGLSSRVRLAFPPADDSGAGVFSHLTELWLEDVRFQDPSALGDAISSARCPCLQTFHICRGLGLEKLAVRSTSLLKLDLQRLGLQELTVEAPELKEFCVMECFSTPPGAEHLPPPVVSITVPGLEVLDWRETITQDAIGFAQELPHLRSLGIFLFFVYGDDDGDSYNRDCLRILQGFRSIQTLALMLVVMDIKDDDEYLMEAINVLPNLTTLDLTVLSDGHCFWDSSLHVLRICPGIRKLVLELSTSPGLEGPCPSDCICRQQSNWQTEELVLVSLQEIIIKGFGQSEHDIGFVEQLFGWATSLTKVKISFDESVTEGVARELCWMFQFLLPNFHIDLGYQNNKMVLRAREEWRNSRLV